MLQPQAAFECRLFTRALHVCADFFLLPECDFGGEIVDHESEFCRALAPVHRTEISTYARAGQQPFKYSMGILPEPQYAVACIYACSGQCVREFVYALC